jgi:hypothetical protein
MGYLGLTLNSDQGVTIRNKESDEIVHIVLRRRTGRQTNVYVNAPRNYEIIRDTVMERPDYQRDRREYFNADAPINNEAKSWS